MIHYYIHYLEQYAYVYIYLYTLMMFEIREKSPQQSRQSSHCHFRTWDHRGQILKWFLGTWYGRGLMIMGKPSFLPGCLIDFQKKYNFNIIYISIHIINGTMSICLDLSDTLSHYFRGLAWNRAINVFLSAGRRRCLQLIWCVSHTIEGLTSQVVTIGKQDNPIWLAVTGTWLSWLSIPMTDPWCSYIC